MTPDLGPPIENENDPHDNWIVPSLFQSGFPFGVSLREVRGPNPCFAFFSLDANQRWVGEFAHVSFITCMYRGFKKTDSFAGDGAVSVRERRVFPWAFRKLEV